jgi:hypothetical protein
MFAYASAAVYYLHIFSSKASIRTKLSVPTSLDSHYCTKKNSKVFVGVFTTAQSADRRALLRKVYRHFNSSLRYKFILGIDSRYNLFLQNENLTFGDLIVLPIHENMNEGKTWEFIRWYSLNVVSDFVMKADDDSFVHGSNLLFELNLLPRYRVYYGMPCHNKAFMCGMGYIFSRDVALLIAATIKLERVGSEDNIAASWMSHFPSVRWIFQNYKFYDSPDFEGCFQSMNRVPHCHSFIDDTLVIHQLKTFDRWLKVTQYFKLKIQ